MNFGTRRHARVLAVGVAIVATMLFAAGCGSSTGTSSPDTGTIVIGSKNFTENEILAQMFADLIQANTKMNVVLKQDMGGTLVDFNALRSGQIDVYPDYTGTGYVEILKQPKPASEQAMYDYVQKQYEKKWGLEWLKPLGFNDTYAVAIPQSLATKDHIETISQLVPYASQLTAGIDAECQNRPDCLPGLEKDYNLKFGQVLTIDHSLVYQAMAEGKIQATDAFTTDGGLEKYHLAVLKDNKGFFPAYYAAAVIRQDFLKQHPEVVGVLNKLAGQISDAEMEHLNYEVDISKKSIPQVAKEFLVSKGLLKG